MKLPVLPIAQLLTMSLPVRECGLKSVFESRNDLVNYVTPRAGVWIEIFFVPTRVRKKTVTPRAGVWIEMKLNIPPTAPVMLSLPVRECGLKSQRSHYL